MLTVALAACSDPVRPRDADAPPAGESGRVTRVDSFPVVVSHDASVIAVPSAGTYWVRKDSTFAYHFEPRPGHGMLSVLGGPDSLLSAVGRVTVRDTVRLTAVAFPDTSVAVRNAADALFDRVVRGTGGTQEALEAWREAYADARLAGDTARLRELDRARFAAILSMGPERWFQILERIDRALAVHAASPPVTARQASPPGPAAGGRLKILYVNGILNLLESFTEGPARMLGGLAAAAGVHGAGGLQPRVVDVEVHYNPAVRFGGTAIEQCVRELLWLRHALGRGADRGVEAHLTRLLVLASQRAHRECIRTNARAIGDYLLQLVGATSSLNLEDQRLLRRVEDLRRQGWNVVIVAHSQGALIARNVLGQLAGPGSRAGCVSLLTLGSPLEYTGADLPRATSVRSIIAKGSTRSIHDLFYYFNGIGRRADGLGSRKTDRYDTHWLTWIPAVPYLPSPRDLATIFIQLELHGVTDTYLEPTEGYGGAVGEALVSAADTMDATCSWIDVTPSAPSQVQVSEAIPDRARLSFRNRSPYRATVSVQPRLLDRRRAPIELPSSPMRVDVDGGRTATLDIPILAQPGVAPGEYELVYDIQAWPTVQGSAGAATSYTERSVLRVKASRGDWLVTDEEATVTVRARYGDPREGTEASVELNGAQRHTFAPAAAEATFRFTLRPGMNTLDFYTEQLPRGQLLVSLEVLVTNAVDPDVRRISVGPLTLRRIDNPARLTIRRQYETR